MQVGQPPVHQAERYEGKGNDVTADYPLAVLFVVVAANRKLSALDIPDQEDAAALGAQALEFSLRWSVGSYFVPIVTLWKPFQALSETFRASHPAFRDNWRSAPAPRLLAVWWTVWLVNSFAGQVLLRITLDAKTVPELLNASWLNLCSAVLQVALVPIVWMLIATLQRWQTGKFGALQNAPSQS